MEFKGKSQFYSLSLIKEIGNYKINIKPNSLYNYHEIHIDTFPKLLTDLSNKIVIGNREIPLHKAFELKYTLKERTCVIQEPTK